MTCSAATKPVCPGASQTAPVDASLRLSTLMQRMWAAIEPTPPRPPVHAVLIHDPGAKRPHDLDDPFFDCAVQIRVADVIARVNHKK